MDQPSFEPLHDIVLLAADEETQDGGGFLLRQEAAKVLRAGLVVAAGPGRWSEHRGERDPMSVGVGQRVLVSSKSGVEVRDGDKTYLAVTEREVLFIER